MVHNYTDGYWLDVFIFVYNIIT